MSHTDNQTADTAQPLRAGGGNPPDSEPRSTPPDLEPRPGPPETSPRSTPPDLEPRPGPPPLEDN